MNILFVKHFFVRFMVSEILRVSVFRHYPYSVTFPYIMLLKITVNNNNNKDNCIIIKTSKCGVPQRYLRTLLFRIIINDIYFNYS